jgi:VanZ family protein
MSSSRTSRFIGPILRWLSPDISSEAVERVQWVVRKSGHVLEYAVLSLLLWRALGQPGRKCRATGEDGELDGWQWGPAFWALLGSFLFAVSDEWHQSWVPSRGASFGDVMLDTAGAVLGLFIVWSWGRWRKVW